MIQRDIKIGDWIRWHDGDIGIIRETYDDRTILIEFIHTENRDKRDYPFKHRCEYPLANYVKISEDEAMVWCI